MGINNEGSPKQLILITYSSSDEAQRAFTNGYKLPDGISYKHPLLFDFMIVRMAQQQNKGGFSSEQDKQQTSQDSSNVASVSDAIPMDQDAPPTSGGGPRPLMEILPQGATPTSKEGPRPLLELDLPQDAPPSSIGGPCPLVEDLSQDAPSTSEGGPRPLEDLRPDTNQDVATSVSFCFRKKSMSSEIKLFSHYVADQLKILDFGYFVLILIFKLIKEKLHLPMLMLLLV